MPNIMQIYRQMVKFMELTLQARPTDVETDKQTEKRFTNETNYSIYGFFFKNIINRILDLFCFERVLNLW